MDNKNKHHKDISIDEEVKKLFRKNEKTTSADFAKLEQKYDSELVNKIQTLYLKNMMQ